jgi:hypothetical protein
VLPAEARLLKLDMIQDLQTGGSMSRKARVDRSPEEKWQIIQEGMKSGNVSERCRPHAITASLFYRWKDEAEQGAKAAFGVKSTEIRSLHRKWPNVFACKFPSVLGLWKRLVMNHCLPFYYTAFLGHTVSGRDSKSDLEKQRRKRTLAVETPGSTTRIMLRRPTESARLIGS